MDQMASRLAGSTQALWLDTCTLERRLVPLPAGNEILVLHSGIQREIAAGDYNIRRAECERAAQLLGLASLRDITDPSVAQQLPEPLGRRVRLGAVQKSARPAGCQGRRPAVRRTDECLARQHAQRL